MHNIYQSCTEIAQNTVSQNFAFRSSHDDFCFWTQCGRCSMYCITKNNYHTYCTLPWYGTLHVCSRTHAPHYIQWYKCRVGGGKLDGRGHLSTLNVVVQSWKKGANIGCTTPHRNGSRSFSMLSKNFEMRISIRRTIGFTSKTHDQSTLYKYISYHFNSVEEKNPL